MVLQSYRTGAAVSVANDRNGSRAAVAAAALGLRPGRVESGRPRLLSADRYMRWGPPGGSRPTRQKSMPDGATILDADSASESLHGTIWRRVDRGLRLQSGLVGDLRAGAH